MLTRFDPLIRQVIKNQIWRVDLRDDAYQEAVFLIARKFCTYRTDQPIEPWLCAVARNACVSMGRKEKRQGRDAKPTPDEDFDRFAQKILPDVDASADSDLNDIHEVWMALKQAYPNRAKMLAFQWHYRDGMTLDEVARRLQMPFNTVKGWPASVLEWLHPRILEELQKRGWEFDAMQRPSPQAAPCGFQTERMPDGTQGRRIENTPSAAPCFLQAHRAESETLDCQGAKRCAAF